MILTDFIRYYKNKYNSFDCVASKSAAFTLAEVLITLGIIGVVVAMTCRQLRLRLTNVQIFQI